MDEPRPWLVPRGWHAGAVALIAVTWLTTVGVVAVDEIPGWHVSHDDAMMLFAPMMVVRCIAGVALAWRGTLLGLVLVAVELGNLWFVGFDHVSLPLFLLPIPLVTGILTVWAWRARRTFAGSAGLVLTLFAMVPVALFAMNAAKVGVLTIPLAILAHWAAVTDFCWWPIRHWRDQLREAELD